MACLSFFSVVHLKLDIWGKKDEEEAARAGSSTQWNVPLVLSAP